MDANEAINNFQKFISSSWDVVALFTGALSRDAATDLIDSWLQANWEILVENSICEIDEFLEVYGNGADCNGASSRVTYPDKLPTHKIVCNAHRGPVFNYFSGESVEIAEINFDRFVSWVGNFYDASPPFDYVLLDHQSETIVVNVNDVQFEVRGTN